VRLLDEPDVMLAAAAALDTWSNLSTSASRSCKRRRWSSSATSHTTSGRARHLVQLVYFGEQVVQKASLVLICYITHNVPDSEELVQAEILTVLEWA
jgi:hypothetical protein